VKEKTQIGHAGLLAEVPNIYACSKILRWNLHGYLGPWFPGPLPHLCANWDKFVRIQLLNSKIGCFFQKAMNSTEVTG